VSVHEESALSAYEYVLEKTRREPSWKLIELQKFIPKGHILDLGMGDGRNSFLFAKLGYEVDCCDTSKSQVKKCNEFAESEGLNVNAEQTDARVYDIQENKYSLIIMSNVLEIFDSSEFQDIATRMMIGLRKGGLLYLKTSSKTYHDIVGPSEKKEMNEEFGPETDGSDYRNHHFTMKEVENLFSGLDTIFLAEGVNRDLSWGTGKDLSKRKANLIPFIEYIGFKSK
jgi:2-polyprenyl-3-methyl-5-hydroxy-6-metoxy-1,4-benzoquinol methylase